MNILILTNSHPMNIVELSRELHSNIIDTDAAVISVQSMALLAEEEENGNYIAYNYVFNIAVQKQPELLKTNKKFNIFYGNLDKNVPIKFDHIFTYKGSYSTEQDFDAYLKMADERIAALDKPSLQWYTPEDAEYEFITLRHLLIMLQTLGVKVNGI